MTYFFFFSFSLIIGIPLVFGIVFFLVLLERRLMQKWGESWWLDIAFHFVCISLCVFVVAPAASRIADAILNFTP